MHKGEMHITFKDLKEASKSVTDPIKKKFTNILSGIQETPNFVFKKKSQPVDDDGYEEGKSKAREIDIPDPYIPPQE